MNSKELNMFYHISHLKFTFIFYTELPKYYTRLQTAVIRGLGWPASRLVGHHTDAAPKHSLLFQISFRVDGHAHRRTFAKRRR